MVSVSKMNFTVLLVLFASLLNESVTFALKGALRTRTSAAAVGGSSSRPGFQLKPGRFLSHTSYQTKRHSALFQSSECAEAERYPSRDVLDTVQGNLANLHHVATKKRRAISTLLAVSSKATLHTLKKCWWCLPMIVALIPPYFLLVHRTFPTMPTCWSLVKLDSVTAGVLGMFLLSNIAYFASGIYLFLRYHFAVPSETREVSFRDPLLGASVLTAGAVSTVFHSVQALGPQSLAECLCFIDHGVAISSIFYFWFRCGRPSRRTWVLSLAGMATLSITEGYAWLHSAWHLLSASAAVVWARDGLGPQNSKHFTVL